MTREEAIICLKGIKNYGRDTFTEQTNWQDCLDMAIKALEQKFVLDKIREIVTEWQSDTWTDNLSYECMIKIAELVEPQESEE